MASTEVNLEDMTVVTEQGMFGLLGTDDPNLRPLKKKKKVGEHPAESVEISDNSQR